MADLNRRGFLGGLSSAFAAPAIVRLESLMPVKVFDPYYTSYIVAYRIDIDEYILRIARSLAPFTVIADNHAAWTVPEHVAHRVISKKIIEAIRPKRGEASFVDAFVPHMMVRDVDRYGNILFGRDRVIVDVPPPSVPPLRLGDR